MQELQPEAIIVLIEGTFYLGLILGAGIISLSLLKMFLSIK